MQAPGPTGPQEHEICFKDNIAYYGNYINHPQTTRTQNTIECQQLCFAGTGIEEEADTISGLGTRSLEGATSRAVWMVNSMPYNSMEMYL